MKEKEAECLAAIDQWEGIISCVLGHYFPLDLEAPNLGGMKGVEEYQASLGAIVTFGDKLMRLFDNDVYKIEASHYANERFAIKQRLEEFKLRSLPVAKSKLPTTSYEDPIRSDDSELDTVGEMALMRLEEINKDLPEGKELEQLPEIELFKIDEQLFAGNFENKKIFYLTHKITLKKVIWSTLLWVLERLKVGDSKSYDLFIERVYNNEIWAENSPYYYVRNLLPKLTLEKIVETSITGEEIEFDKSSCGSLVQSYEWVHSIKRSIVRNLTDSAHYDASFAESLAQKDLTEVVREFCPSFHKNIAK